MNRTPQYDINVAQEILTRLMIARTQMGNGQVAQRVMIDGQEVTYRTLAEIGREISEWERRVAILSGRRRRAINIDLGHWR